MESAVSFACACRTLFTELHAAVVRGKSNRATPSAEEDYPYHIDFTANGNSWRYRLFGWDNPETFHSWTSGHEAFLRVPTPRHPQPLLLNARLEPFASPRCSYLNVGILVGHEQIGTWTVACPGHYFCIVWPRFFTGEHLDICFSIPAARSPRSEGMSDDPRVLGLMFRDVWLTPLTPVSI